MKQFNSSELISSFENSKNSFLDIANNNINKLKEVKNKFEKEIMAFESRGYLTVAFVGEYSAGKSTIISALTGIKDIKISADIATGETTEYNWNGIKIIDTPGLYTDRADHDKITLDSLKEADLLVFCLTHSLFDSITAENFKDLAFKYSYKNKMMLVVNKFSSEAGEDIDKIESYKYSLQEALNPENLDLFPLSFIDALDYIDGMEDNDNELIELSRFNSFIENLNNFTEQNKIYGKLDTPIRILNSALDDAVSVATRNNIEDNTKLELLSKMTRIIKKERKNLTSASENIILDLNFKIISLGGSLTSELGSNENFEAECKEAEKKIQDISEDAGEEINIAIKESFENLRENIQEVLNGPLYEHYLADFEKEVVVNPKNYKTNDSVKELNKSVNSFNTIARTASKTIGEIAIKDGTKMSTNFSDGLLKSSQAAGSQLHQGIKLAGNVFGVKFKPWQAVNLAKNIGNVMKFAGPVLSIVTLIMDVNQVQEDEKNAKELLNARKDVNATFHGIANEMEKEFKKNIELVMQENFKPIEDEITNARKEEEQFISMDNLIVAEIINIREELDTLLGSIG